MGPVPRYEKRVIDVRGCSGVFGQSLRRWPSRLIAGRASWDGEWRKERDTPTPGGFWQRVRKRLKIKGLSFFRAQKSLQAFEKKEDSSETRWNVPTRSGSELHNGGRASI
jgi:hypothetical protein